MIRDKAQTAQNGGSFSRAAPRVGALRRRSWGIWVPPCGRAGKPLSVALRLLARARPLPARRALRSTTSQLAELAVIALNEHS